MRPLAQSDGRDAPSLIDERVPHLAAVADEIVIGFVDAAGEPIVAHALPDVLDRVEFGAFRRPGETLICALDLRRWCIHFLRPRYGWIRETASFLHLEMGNDAKIEAKPQYHSASVGWDC